MDPMTKDQAILEHINNTDTLPVAFYTPSEHETNTLTYLHCVNVPIHWHEYIEILYLLEESMTAVVQSETFKLTYGDMLIVNSGELHSTQLVTESSDSQYTLLQIPSTLLDQLLPGFDSIRFDSYITAESIAATPRLKEALSAMETIYHDQQEGWQLDFNAALYTFLSSLYKYHSHHLIDTKISESNTRDMGRMIEIVEWVRNNSTANITLEDAASQVNITKEYFCRLFKKYTGQTFLDYLTTVRTMNLYEDLRNSDASLERLLEKHGITNYKTFMRTFKKLYGITPRQIRKQL